MRAVITLSIVGLLLTACGVNPPLPTTLVNECSLPRPQVCTMEYAPVCAHLIAGGRLEYSSPCNACADDAVASYLGGSCPTKG